MYTCIAVREGPAHGIAARDVRRVAVVLRAHVQQRHVSRCKRPAGIRLTGLSVGNSVVGWLVGNDVVVGWLQLQPDFMTLKQFTIRLPQHL